MLFSQRDHIEGPLYRILCNKKMNSSSQESMIYYRLNSGESITSQKKLYFVFNIMNEALTPTSQPVNIEFADSLNSRIGPNLPNFIDLKVITYIADDNFPAARVSLTCDVMQNRQARLVATFNATQAISGEAKLFVTSDHRKPSEMGGWRKVETRAGEKEKIASVTFSNTFIWYERIKS